MFSTFLLLSKRFLKNPIYLTLLLMVPLLSYGLFVVSSGSEAAVRAGFVIPGSDSHTNSRIEDCFLHRMGVIEYTQYDSEEEARQDVLSGQIYAAIIIPEYFDDTVLDFMDGKVTDERKIKFIVETDGVRTNMIREQVYGRLFPIISELMFYDFIEKDSGDTDRETLGELFTKYAAEHDLDVFRLEWPDGGQITESGTVNYLVSPVRGILAILIIVTAFASAIFLFRDGRCGRLVFVSLSGGMQGLRLYLRVFIPVVYISFICAVAIYSCGLSDNLIREIALILIYSLLATAFAIVVSSIYPDEIVCMCEAAIVAVMCALLSPIFLPYGIVPRFGDLLPPTLYIMSAHGNSSVVPLCIYTVVMVCLSSAVLGKIMPRIYGD